MTPDLGTLERVGDKDVLRFERRLDHPVERVWRALTEPSELMGWWGDAEIDLRPGGRFRVRWLNTDDSGETAVQEGTITELDPPHVLETDGEPHGTLRFELRADGDGTMLTFTGTVDLPEQYRTMNLAGWHTHLDFLRRWLDDGERADLVNVEEPWAPIHERYVAALG
jgi:uncharacterized protein YndB with AHSA1/START domain